MKFTHYSEFKNIFSNFDRVVVTGPQRSGTKIVANMISIDTGFDLIRHTVMAPPINIDKFKNAKNIVLHNPSYVAFLEDIQDDRTAIVYCLRNLDDVLLSEEKWNMRADNNLLRELTLLHWKGYIRKSVIYKEINPAKIKNILWEHMLVDILKNTFTVKYEDLEGHELWVPKEERAKFKDVNQISSDGTIYRVKDKLSE